MEITLAASTRVEGQRAGIFAADPDPLVYLDAPGGPKLCRAHFRRDDCTNRRCKWSHAACIAEFANDASDDPWCMANEARWPGHQRGPKLGRV